MKTIVYIDGFNLYYNLFRGNKNYINRPYKWLDLQRFSEKVIGSKYKKNKIEAVKYYTANISGKHDNTKPERQNAYLRALELHCSKLEIIIGKFLVEKAYRARTDNEELIEVYLPEEKGSDVNLATHMLYDAVQNNYEVAAVFSNDTDLTEAFRIVSSELKKKILLIQPETVKTAKSLRRYSFDVLRFDTTALAKNQMPDCIGPKIKRPEEWT